MNFVHYFCQHTTNSQYRADDIADRAGGMRAARAANGFSPPKLDAKLTTVRAR